MQRLNLHSYKRSIFWFFLALVGQAASLQLIDAGARIHYQHYLPLNQVAASPWALLLALQTLLVGWGLFTQRRKIGAWLKAHFRRWQTLLALGVLLIAGAAPSASRAFYLGELVLATWIQLLNIGNLVLVLLSLPEAAGERARRFFEDQTPPNRQHREPPGLFRRYAWLLLAAAWVVIVAAALNLTVYENFPHVQDEVIYFWQARLLAEGRLTMPAPLVPQAFAIYMVPEAEPTWFGIFPPGWPAVLAVGLRIGLPWLMNPLLAGVNLLLAYALLARLYSPRTARIAVLLLCVSPWYLFMAMNFMSHTLALTCALAAAVWFTHAQQQGRAAPALFSGAAVGALSLVRPQDGVIIAALFGLWGLGLGGRRLRLPVLVAFGLGVFLVGGLILPYNSAITGQPLSMPLERYYHDTFGPDANAMGFGPGRGLGWGLDAYPGHSPLEAGVNGLLNLNAIQTELFGWGGGSLLFVLALLAIGRLNRSDWMMAAVVIGVVAFYSLYWFSGGPDFGARYWYLLIIPLAALSARAIETLAEKRSPGASLTTPSAAWAIPGLLAILALATFLPWRAADKYKGYLGMGPEISSLAEQVDFGRSIVLIQGVEHPDYSAAWIHNPTNYAGDETLYAFERSPEVRTLLERAYPDRPIWVVAGPSLTAGTYQVVAAPH